MASIHELLQLATNNFDKAIDSLRDSNFSDISAPASRTVEKIQFKEILVALNNGEFHNPGSTSFHLHQLHGIRNVFTPLIVIDHNRMISDTK